MSNKDKPQSNPKPEQPKKIPGKPVPTERLTNSDDSKKDSRKLHD